MNSFFKFIGIVIFLLTFCKANAQKDDSSSKANIAEILKLHEQESIDSLSAIDIKNQLLLTTGDREKTKQLETQLAQIMLQDSLRKEKRLARIEELKKHNNPFPICPFGDTLFYVYTKIGSFGPAERAQATNKRILNLYNDAFYNKDSLAISETENGFDIVYSSSNIILSVTEFDALWLGKPQSVIVKEYFTAIKNEIAKQREANSLSNLLKRVGLSVLIIAGLFLLIYFINKFFNYGKQKLLAKKDIYLSGLSIRNINLLTPSQLETLLTKGLNLFRVFVIILTVYISLPLLFSLFPVTQHWTNTLIGWILTPAKAALLGIINYLPNLFTIAIVYFIFRYAIKALKFFVSEIEKGTISLDGFHPDWAKPTSNIVKFLLYALMLIIIFPYLPGSGSGAFQGVSVFLGVLLSLGSSSAISNMVAGLVITYMRPFKVGDRVKIAEMEGDVVEKTMLVTRIRTIKNEDITIPNSTVLTGSTINYSSYTKPNETGLILHTTVTIGYDVPWKNMHQALIDAALRTDFVLKEPKPFVLQTSLEDFYVAYQINVYTKESNKQALIYSSLHQNIQDCCNEVGIEILSPHYRGIRDGNMTTIPADYLPKNYETPSFNIIQTPPKK